MRQSGLDFKAETPRRSPAWGFSFGNRGTSIAAAGGSSRGQSMPCNIICKPTREKEGRTLRRPDGLADSLARAQRQRRPKGPGTPDNRDEFPSPHEPLPEPENDILSYRKEAIVRHSKWRARNDAMGQQLPRDQATGVAALPPKAAAVRRRGS